MSYNAWSVFFDVAVIGVLLVVGQILRAKLGIMQKFMIPASLTAGCLGLLLGPSGFNFIPFSVQMSNYSSILIVLVFAALPIGNSLKSLKRMGREVGEMWNCVSVSALSQYGWGMLFSMFVLGIFWQLHPGFGYILATGFFGGHGTAAAVAETFKSYGWGDEAFSLGMTCATAGIAFAIIPGVIMNNWATRKGLAKGVASPEKVADPALLTGLVPKENRKPIGMETISGSSLESLSFHFSLIMVAAVMGWYANKFFKILWPTVDIPTFCLALFAGYIIQLLMEVTHASDYIDRKTMTTISGFCADLLIVAGISAIKIAVVVKYAVPLGLLLVFGFALCVFLVVVLGPKMFKEYWYEKSIFVYGFATGSLVNSILLLRMIDPEMKSKSLDTYAVVGLLDRPLFVALIALGPVFIGTGYGVHFAVVCSLLTFVPIIFAKMMGWWYKDNSWQAASINAVKTNK